jgi:N-acetylglucosamine kinase-like BadF-type ATPase
MICSRRTDCIFLNSLHEIMNHYFLGVDIGSTKSHALIADRAGTILGFGQAGAGNYQVVDYPGMAAALRQATSQALAVAGLTIDQIAYAGLGISGYDWPSQRPQMIRTIREAGVVAPLEVVNDAILGLLAGASDTWGVALVAGTGSNCYGRDQQGRTGRVTGEGIHFGEYGGAGELAILAQQAVSRAWSHRGPATDLSDAFIAAAGARNLDDLMEGLALSRYRLGAKVAPLIFQVARAGDRVAREVIALAGRELADLAIGVIRQLSFEQQTFDVVLVGSLYNGGELLIEPLRTAIHAVAPGARLTRLTAPPVVGGVLLAMEQDGSFQPAVRDVLIRNTIERLPTTAARDTSVWPANGS